MKRVSIIALTFACCAAYAHPLIAEELNDFSGVYNCAGNDHQDGKYQGTVTLELVPAQSFKKYRAYHLKLEVPGYGTYLSQAATHDTQMAIYFANTETASKDYGTGIASFSKNKDNKWLFSTYYYQAEYKGGNFGTETCTQR